jgi:undecaprenyl-diphosphatase
MDLDRMLALDVALHAATLAAVLVYFGRAWAARLRREPGIVVPALAAGVPAGLLYLIAGAGPVEAVKGSLLLLGAAFLAAGAFLAYVSLSRRRAAPNESGFVPRGRLGLVAVAAVGCAQAAALFPGVSRSGVTIGAGLLGGLGREAAFEFSFMAGAPLMLGALAVKARDVVGLAGADGLSLAAGAAVAFASGLAALAGLRRLVTRRALWPFGLYTAALGIVCMLLGTGG